MFEEIHWAWALANVRLDIEDRRQQTESALKYLAAFISPEAYTKVYGKGSFKAPEMTDSYAAMLQAAGVSSSDISAFSPDNPSTNSEPLSSDDLDEVKILKAPPSTP